MLRVASALMVVGTVAAFTLAGCNAVLGIDEAHLAAESAGKHFDPTKDPDKSPVGQFAAKCDKPSDACAGCEETNDCALSKPDCLADPKCRFALDSYRSCLGNPCTDPAGECLNELAKVEISSTAGLGFAKCVHNTCPSECQASPLVSSCEEYCGCMVGNCSAEIDHADLQACIKSCGAMPPAAILCRWTHCEMAPNDLAAGHCRHALGLDGRCTAPTATQPTCTDRSQNDFICHKPSDCCSNFCRNGFCEPPQ